MTLSQAKSLAKKLFAKIHNLPVYLVTISRIKKAYPFLKVNSCDSWLDLVDVLILPTPEEKTMTYAKTGYFVQITNIEGKVLNFTYTYGTDIDYCKTDLRTYKLGRKRAFSEEALNNATYTRMTQEQFDKEIAACEKDFDKW